jgi:5-methylcytosine-specific restriction protein B
MANPVAGARNLTADDLDIGYEARAHTSRGSSAPDAPVLDSDDPRMKEIARLLDQFGGVILSGPPGTSKSWLAGQAADLITGGDRTRQAFIQFHASYQFEDFMEGFQPKKSGKGFEPRRGVFLTMVDKAVLDSDRPHVVVIDELSRADVGRVFGEALTYVEKSKRGHSFILPSGDQCIIPKNLLLIATMNPLDRGVDDVDAAFERRFAKIEMPPDVESLRQILTTNGVDENLGNRLVAWFAKTNARAKKNPTASVGHAYFSSVVDAPTLRDVWDYQLHYLIDRAFKYDEATHKEVVNGWNKILAGADDEDEAPDDNDQP